MENMMNFDEFSKNEGKIPKITQKGGKKPKNASDSLMVRNAKKKKVSKDPRVKYPDIKGVKGLLGINVHDTDKDKNKK